MTRMFPLLLAAAVAVPLSACAPTAADNDGARGPRSTQCFYADQVDNFRGDNQTLYIQTRKKEVFELQTLGFCADIDFAFSIGFVPDAGFNRLCTGDFSRILVSGGPTPREPCRVQVVKKLTEAEVAALPARDRP
ncbi:hypothetical protein D3C73_51200 [compost metagenome]